VGSVEVKYIVFVLLEPLFIITIEHTMVFDYTDVKLLTTKL